MNSTQSRLAKLIKNISKDFSLEKLSKSPARFDLQKLTWFNRQFIQMMSLDEFVSRAFELKLSIRSKDTKLRIGDYAYLVDFETGRTFVQCYDFGNDMTDSPHFHQIGGGRVEGEDSVSSLSREVYEETDGKLTIDPTKLIKLESFEISFSEPRKLSHPVTNLPESYDGKIHHTYVYPLSELKIGAMTNSEAESFKWADLIDVLGANNFITYPVWKQFCQKNNLKLVEPNNTILKQYLAWQLDKNRVNLLTELGSESDCITNWIKPSQESVTWKKITKEESLNNLKEIKNVIENLYNNSELNIKEKQAHLYNKVKNEIYFETSREIESGLAEMTAVWENLLKNWIGENGKDAGSYFWPLRVALSGKSKSPSPFEILSILSLEEVISRVDEVLK